MSHVFPPIETVLVVGIRRPSMTRKEMQASLAELKSLLETAGALPIETCVQELKTIHPATFIGGGKVSEVKTLVETAQADFVAIDDDLTPVQNRNLEAEFGVRVLDRPAVILDIFALRARSAEGKLQVELAQLEYVAPRLVGRGLILSQQTGRIGTRGPGETALEVERRRLRDRVAFLKRRLEEVRAHRDLHRQKRSAVPLPLISLVGYTNAGKSTLMNTLTNADVFVEDKLFATLDPTVRRLKLPSGREVLLADTVGFIRRLPHQLVKAFRATFEEIAASALLIHVVDAGASEVAEHATTVERVLRELNLHQKPRLTVLNKIDQVASPPSLAGIPISALKGKGIATLLDNIDRALLHDLSRVILLLPHTRGDMVNQLYRLGHVVGVAHQSRGIRVVCDLPPKLVGKYAVYRV